jgi:3-hydroxyacyl-[acyl-carrier-protein] dehydratase
MPPSLLYDISGIDLDQVLFGKQAILEANPQRGPMEHLDAIVYADPAQGRIVGYKDVRCDEFWVEGHIPGRPLLPGVLMIEAAAQLASFYTRKFVGWKGFIGFGGADEIRFRLPVVPPCRMYLIGQKIWERHHRLNCKVQGVVNGAMVFETAIIGAEL